MTTPAFYSSINAPDYFVNATDTIYKSIPLDVVKKQGIWNNRLDRMLPLLPDNTWIAGGFLRAMIAGEDDRNGDIDLFFGNSDAFNKTLNMIKHPTKETKNVFGWYSIPEYETAIENLRVVDCISDMMFRPNLQLIRLWWFNSPIKVIDGFDLTICQVAIDKENLYFNPKAFDDIQSRTINMHRYTGSALSMLNRILKYKDKGYAVDPALFDKIEADALKVLKTPNEINEYFYADKQNTSMQKRPISFLKHAWDYLEENPKTTEAYKKAMKVIRRPAFRSKDHSAGVWQIYA